MICYLQHLNNRVLSSPIATNTFIHIDHQSLGIRSDSLGSRKMAEEDNPKKEKVEEKVIKIRDTGGKNSEEVIAKRSSSSEETK